jgi:hypothetical protein
MTPLERFEQALRSPSPAHSLRSVVTSLSQDGLTQASIYAALEELLLELRQGEQPSDSQEELVLDVMDALSGWCHPSASLLKEGDSL